MGITVTDLSTLNQTQVNQFETQLVELIQEYAPTVDVNGGVFQDLLLHLKAVLDTATQENITLVQDANSLKQINANPALADTTIVDNCISNFNLVRNLGTIASGSVTFVLSQLIGAAIPSGSTFTINGIAFISPVSYSARTSQSAVISPTDVLISPIGNGQYSFTIVLDAAAVGAAGNVTIGSAVTPDSPPPAFVKAYVLADFIGGTDPSTNAALLQQLASGMAIAAWANRTTDASLILKQPGFGNIQSMSIIGFGDPEMLRDQHTIWPGSIGGRADLYLRSQPLYQNVTVSVTATLVATVGPLGTWQFGIGRDVAPGFYTVANIYLPDQDPTLPWFSPISDIRGFDTSGIVQPPDITLGIEAVYSRYQTAIIQFVDFTTDAGALIVGTSQQTYEVVLTQMPLVSNVQDFLIQRGTRPPGGDVLVKAPIPAMTEVSFTVNYTNGTTAPVISTIQNVVATAVNALNFTGQLPASLINQVIHANVPNAVSVTGMSMEVTIFQIDGSSLVLTDSILITIPNSYMLMESARTTAFFLNPSDVTVTLVAV